MNALRREIGTVKRKKTLDETDCYIVEVERKIIKIVPSRKK